VLIVSPPWPDIGRQAVYGRPFAEHLPNVDDRYNPGAIGPSVPSRHGRVAIDTGPREARHDGIAAAPAVARVRVGGDSDDVTQITIASIKSRT